MTRAFACIVLLVTMLAGCSGQAAVPPGPPDPASSAPTTPAGPPAASSATSSSAPTTSSTPTPGTVSGGPGAQPVLQGDRYADLARDLQQLGVEVWFETDLVAPWLEGPAAFGKALDRISSLSALPGLKGFKIADELGYHDGITSVAQASSFLHAVRDELTRRAPESELVVDMVVPELGCLAWVPDGSASCRDQGRTVSPAATAAAVSGYLEADLIDRLNLSTSLLDESTYRSWGLSRQQAQTEAWAHVEDLGWSDLTVLQARKALADVDGYQGSAQTADDDVRTYVDIPTAAGATGVDIWTWRQQYDGNMVGLLGPDLADNPLWTELLARHADDVSLSSHITPSLLPDDAAARAREIARVAEVFDAMLVAAGTE